MNLKENFERFFKTKLEDKKEQKHSKLTESQLNRFSNIAKVMAIKYPNAPLTLKEGYVWMGNKKVEPIESFLSKSGPTIQEEVRSFSNSGKKGLL